MSKGSIKFRIPSTATKGEIIEIRTIIEHPMVTGLQKNKKTGKKIPRDIINKFVCTFNGKTVMTSHWETAVSANPYLAFPLRATESGKIEMKWFDDDGKVYSASANITVS